MQVYTDQSMRYLNFDGDQMLFTPDTTSQFKFSDGTQELSYVGDGLALAQKLNDGNGAVYIQRTTADSTTVVDCLGNEDSYTYNVGTCDLTNDLFYFVIGKWTNIVCYDIILVLQFSQFQEFLKTKTSFFVNCETF